MIEKDASGSPLARVRFEPDGIEVSTPLNTLVCNIALSAGSPIETTCGCMGTCGKCRVMVQGAVSPPDAAEIRLLTEEDRKAGVRLACRTRVTGDVVITIPESSRSLVQQILSTSILREVHLDPGVSTIHLKLTPPSLEDERAEFERLKNALLPQDINLRVDLDQVRDISDRMRASNYDITAVVAGDLLIAVEAGDTSEASYGMAFDLGSTTVVGFLMDLSAGHEVAVASAMNLQMAYGDDLISRINFAANEPNGREILQKTASDVMNRLIREVTSTANVDPRNIYEITVVGNTCMTHLFLGIDPKSLGQSPYVPAVCKGITESASRLGLDVCPGARVHVLPNVAGFVGSDLLAVLLAGLWEDDGRTRLAVDIGTNGEMALRHNGKTYACSAAAGPAFEGARISCGMRGSPGAIDSVQIDDDVRITTIDDLPAAGLCGSGLIDAIAALLDVGLLDETGRLLDLEEAVGVSDKVRERIVEVNGERGFVLATARASLNRSPVVLLQKDIRQLQLAKGSIRAAIETLLKIAGADVKELAEVLLAGAFGNYISKDSAVRIGLVPALPSENIKPIGNAAGAGARLALISCRERAAVDRIAKDVHHVELANHPDYQNEFMSQMLFPTHLSVG